MSVHNVVISGTGLYTPANSISNDELVASFNAYVQQFNADNAAAIEREVAAVDRDSAPRIDDGQRCPARQRDVLRDVERVAGARIVIDRRQRSDEARTIAGVQHRLGVCASPERDEQSEDYGNPLQT